METVLRKDHPDTLVSMMNLVESLCQQGKYTEAKMMRQRADRLDAAASKKQKAEHKGFCSLK